MGKVPPSFRLLRCSCGFQLLLLVVVVAATAGAAASFVVDIPVGLYYQPTRSSSLGAAASLKPLILQHSRNGKSRRNGPPPFAAAKDPLSLSPISTSSSADAASCGCTATATTTRRGAFARGVATAAASGWLSIFPTTPSLAAAADAADASVNTLDGSRAALVEAQSQLFPIPDYIKAEKWDSVRAALLRKPLNDLWSKASSNVATAYAERVGDAGGDELGALELRESLSSHLRYLDMAVYNNVFNPISTQGTIGASADLVKSYYDDPTNEYRASLEALQQLIALSDRLVP
jgi:hypothetical protein